MAPLGVQLNKPSHSQLPVGVVGGAHPGAPVAVLGDAEAKGAHLLFDDDNGATVHHVCQAVLSLCRFRLERSKLDHCLSRVVSYTIIHRAMVWMMMLRASLRTGTLYSDHSSLMSSTVASMMMRMVLRISLFMSNIIAAVL